MADDELAKIRQQRLAQLQAAKGQGPTGPQAAAMGPGGQGKGDDKQRQQQQAKEAEMRNNILSGVLTQEARARLSTLGAAKPDRARMVEDIIIQNYRMGAIRGKVDEDALKGLLEKVQETRRETKVKYERRRVFDDEDEDED